MAVIEMINGKGYLAPGGRMKRVSYKTHASMRKLIDYIFQDKKTEQILKQGVGCNPETAYKEFLLTKHIHDKAEDGKRRMVIHFTQSFKPGEVTPQEAQQIATELLRHSMFRGFQVAYATHVDREHIHTHFVINACNQESGTQWHISSKQLEALKTYSDELCKAHELTVIQKGIKQQHMTYGEHKANENGASWKMETKMAVDNVMKLAISREDFIHKMNELGYHVNWSDERKYITFSFEAADGTTKRIRNNKLRPEGRYTKDALEKRFNSNAQYQEQRAKRLEEEERAEHDNEVDQMVAGAGVLFRLAANLSKSTHYPYQRQAKIDRLKSDNIEAKIERSKDAKKGYGIEWE